MKSVFFKTFMFIALLGMSTTFFCKAQDPYEEKSKLLDLKMQLIDAKIALLDSKLKIFETKPEEFDAAIRDIEKKLSVLDFDPNYYNYKFRQMDSLLNATNKKPQEPSLKRYKPFRYDTVTLKPFQYAITMNPLSLSSGTLELGFERIINRSNSVEFTGSVTYATEYGISNLYMKNQSLEYYNASLSSYRPYNPKNIIGFGVSAGYRNYLLAAINPKQVAPKGLYIEPLISYRRVHLFGTKIEMIDSVNRQIEIDRPLNIFTGGIVLGTKFSILKVLVMDCYIGGAIKLSKYDDEKKFTKYKNLINIDYSGVMPTAGIKVGILK